MTGEWKPADQTARDRIESELGTSLFVEAGAGAGKTTALVSRVVALIASGRAKVEEVAAITFTEAAAAELRERVREGMEQRTAGERGAEADRCRAALENLESASIQTLHSFAGALLRERPLEAGLPPGFEVADPIASDLAFDEAWQGWLDTALDSAEAAGSMRQAIRLGLRPDNLHEMAKIFHDNYDRLNQPVSGPGLSRAAHCGGAGRRPARDQQATEAVHPRGGRPALPARKSGRRPGGPARGRGRRGRGVGAALPLRQALPRERQAE